MIKNDKFIPLFNELRLLLKKYERLFNAVIDKEGSYHLINKKELIIDGRKRDEMYFASILIQKSYVGFYYMPVYIETEMKNMFSTKLLKLKKGKSCFYIKLLDEELKSDIINALDLGIKLYQEKGWI